MPNRSRRSCKRRSGRWISAASERDRDFDITSRASSSARPNRPREIFSSDSSGSESNSGNDQKRSKGRPKQNRGPVWDEYGATSDSERMECLKCHKRIKVNKGSKSGLEAHLRMHRKHGTLVANEAVKRWLVASMVTVLRIPLNAFNSLIMSILFWLASLGPINSNLARKYSDFEAKRARELLASDLVKLRQNGVIFTLTADEWSWQRKRFLGVTLHSSAIIPCISGKSIQLLTRFHERASAKNLEKVLLETLDSVGLSIKDIKGITTDAASVMRKLGKSLQRACAPEPFFHQLCFAHGIHLAVLDTFKANDLVYDEDSEALHMVGICDDSDGEGIDELCELEEQDEAGPPTYRGSAGELLTRIRQISFKFKKSPAMNDELLACSTNASQSGRKLVVDVKTRWFSSLRMLRNFVALEETLRAHYSTRASEDFPFSESEIIAAKDVIAALSHAEKCVKRLSEEEVTMRDADIAMQAMLRMIRADSTKFTKRLARNLSIRILQRRDAASRLAMYVEDYEESTDLDRWLEEISKAMIAEGREDIYRTFIQSGSLEEVIAKYQQTPAMEAETEPEEEPQAADEVFDDYALRVVNRKKKNPPLRRTFSAKKLMRMHNEGFESFSPGLRSVLNTVQPTSVPAERAFSVARHLRRYCQESQADARFSDYLFLRNFYQHTKPWRVFKAEYSMTEECDEEDNA